MICPHCQAEQPEPPRRFCDACGLAIPRPPRREPAARRRDARDEPVRCSSCGMVARARRCFRCGAPVRWPEGVAPPAEVEEGGWTRHRTRAARAPAPVAPASVLAGPAPAPAPTSAAPVTAPAPDDLAYTPRAPAGGRGPTTG